MLLVPKRAGNMNCKTLLLGHLLNSYAKSVYKIPETVKLEDKTLTLSSSLFIFTYSFTNICE